MPDHIFKNLQLLLVQGSISVPVSFVTAIKKLPNADLLEASIDVSIIKFGKVTVTIKTERIFFIQDMIVQAQNKKKKVSRAELAITGDTHDVPSQYSILTIAQDNNIFAVPTSDSTFSPVGFVQNKDAVVIENMDNFFAFHSYKQILDLPEGIDVIYGQGMNIANSKNTGFLEKYDTIYTFFDLDLAGFQMYVSLKNNLKDVVVKNVFPERLIEYFQSLKEKDAWQTIHRFIKENASALNEEDMYCLSLIKRYGSMEQEIFIGGLVK